MKSVNKFSISPVAIVIALLIHSSSVAVSAPNIVVWGTNSVGSTNIPPALTNVVAITAGAYHCLALRPDKKITSWGYNAFGQTNVPSNVTNVAAFSAGQLFSMALLSDRTVSVWGDNSYWQLGVPPLNPVVAVAGSGNHCMALQSNGTVVVWGNSGDVEYLPPTGLTNVIGIAASTYNCLAAKADGTVVAWGSQPTNVPTGLSNVVAVAGGVWHSLALRIDGTVVAWGGNTYGQTNVPTDLANVVAIDGGDRHSVALRSDGTVVGWGTNTYGATNIPAGLTNVVAISAGKDFNIALVGSGPPVIAPAVEKISSVVGFPFFLGVSATGKWPLSFQWYRTGVPVPNGTNAYVQATEAAQGYLNNRYYCVVSNSMGVATSKQVWVFVSALKVNMSPVPVVAWIGQTYTFSVGIQSIDPVITYQWRKSGADISGATNLQYTIPSCSFNDIATYSLVASNGYGSATGSVNLGVNNVAVWGDNPFEQQNVPYGLSNVVAIGAGENHSLAIQSNRNVIAWGYNFHSQTNVPAGLTNVVAASGGDTHSVVLKNDGKVIAWGYNNSGQTNVPSSLSNAVAVSGGYRHNVALRSNGTVVAWGTNTEGQLNIPAGLTNVVSVSAGTRDNLALKADGKLVAWGYRGTNTPVDLSNVTMIAAGYNHWVALKSNGTVVAWGDNSFGQTNIPADLNDAVAVSASYNHTLALRSNGTVVAWGDNSYGQGAVPAGLSNVVAICAARYHSLAVIGVGKPFIAPVVGQVESGLDCPIFSQVSPAGELPMACVWKWNGTPVQTAQSGINYIQMAQTGSYHLVANNSFGTTTSGTINIKSTLLDNDGDGMDDRWETYRGLNLTTNDATEDKDSDGMSNYDEWLAGTDPSSSNSLFIVKETRPINGSNIVIRWPSSVGRFYSLESATNLLETNTFQIIPAATNLPATPPENCYTDNVVPLEPTYFYKIKATR